MKNRVSTTRRVLKRSWILVTAATLLALPAMAGAPKGVAHVKNVNLAKRTLTLMGDEYIVTDETVIVDVRGTSTELKALRPAPTDGSLFGDEDVDAVEWRAVQTPTGWVLTDLRVLKKLPD